MTERFVVDASVVAKLYLRDEKDLDKADLLFSRFSSGDIELVAPKIITYEIPATIKNGVARVGADEKTWREALLSFQNLGLLVIDDSEAKEDAIRFSLSHYCQFYDALYLLLAQELGLDFITADEKIIRSLHHKLTFIFPLNTYK